MLLIAKKLEIQLQNFIGSKKSGSFEKSQDKGEARIGNVRIGWVRVVTFFRIGCIKEVESEPNEYKCWK